MEFSDFSGSHAEDWPALKRLAARTHQTQCEDGKTGPAVFVWLLQQCSLDIRENYDDQYILEALDFKKSIDAVKSLLKLGGDGAIDAYAFRVYYPKLMRSIASRESLEEMSGLGADIYHVAFAIGWSPFWETPLSLAMYSSQASWIWRAFLRICKVDIDEFVEVSMEMKIHRQDIIYPMDNKWVLRPDPVEALGWNRDTLHKLLEMVEI